MGDGGRLIRVRPRTLRQSALTSFVTQGRESRRTLGGVQCEDFVQRLEQRNAKTILLLNSFI